VLAHEKFHNIVKQGCITVYQAESPKRFSKDHKGTYRSKNPNI